MTRQVFRRRQSPLIQMWPFYAAILYPDWADFRILVQTLSLKARSLLIKVAQSQTTFTSSSPLTATLPRLLAELPPVITPDTQRFRKGHYTPATFPVADTFAWCGIDVNDFIIAGQVIDILRGAPLSLEETRTARFDGWMKEINLVSKVNRSCVNFEPFFHPLEEPIHPDVPRNARACHAIRRRLERFRDKYQQNTRFLFSRMTHKNMSRSTRREYERYTKSTLENVPIFGQDDYIRYYHETGILLGGEVEMRQKWYPSGAKPRTYFAMGGTTYRSCRFLQDFFTDLVDIFPPTNHDTRLQPSRLSVGKPGSEDDYLVYDLSSFTSNMQEQRAFMTSLSGFFRGTPVWMVDERSGPQLVDLGDLLEDYYAHCVERPVVSLERSPAELGFQSMDEVEHARASLLGIFGNLMTCTLGHYFIMSQCVDDDSELNVAGDDGMVRRWRITYGLVDTCIRLVGDYAEEKCYDSSMEGAVCLKRPLYILRPDLVLGRLSPVPNLNVTISYLLGYAVDPRFEFYDLDAMSVGERISVVGKDLARFFYNAFLAGQGILEQSDAHLSIQDIYRRFVGVVKAATGVTVHSHLRLHGYLVTWPIDPSMYSFFEHDPLRMYCTSVTLGSTFAVRKSKPFRVVDHDDFEDVDDVWVGNQDSRLRLLEVLGYITREEVFEVLEPDDAAVRFYYEVRFGFRLAPALYEYRVVRRIPPAFMFQISYD
jgi:hypothetical protein